jgi:hypothetical protein
VGKMFSRKRYERMSISVNQFKIELGSNGEELTASFEGQK